MYIKNLNKRGLKQLFKEIVDISPFWIKYDFEVLLTRKELDQLCFHEYDTEIT